jgi:hypothetical protein
MRHALMTMAALCALWFACFSPPVDAAPTLRDEVAIVLSADTLAPVAVAIAAEYAVVSVTQSATPVIARISPCTDQLCSHAVLKSGPRICTPPGVPRFLALR